MYLIIGVNTAMADNQHNSFINEHSFGLTGTLLWYLPKTISLQPDVVKKKRENKRPRNEGKGR